MSNMNYNIDIVMCIDATGSMSPVIELVKSSASGFHDRLTTALDAKEKKITPEEQKSFISLVSFEVKGPTKIFPG